MAFIQVLAIGHPSNSKEIFISFLNGLQATEYRFTSVWVTFTALLYKTDFLPVAYYFDELIVSEIRKKNEVVLRELYKTHYPMVVHLVCSNNGTEQEAKDIYQEAIMAFYERVQQPAFTLTCKIKTYLYAVAWRLWLKKLAEKKKFNGSVDEVETFIGIEEEMLDIQEKENRFKRMGTSLEGLGEPCRGIIEDFYVNNLSMEEISTKFGYTNADNAKNQKYKCLQRLKKLFFEDFKEVSHG